MSACAAPELSAPAGDRAEPIHHDGCLECGGAVTGRRGAEFCCSPCRAAWNSRRAVRGAELYDLVMGWRFERRIGALSGVMTLLCRAVSLFRDEDRRARGGRRSWSRPRTVVARRPYLAAVILDRGRA